MSLWCLGSSLKSTGLSLSLSYSLLVVFEELVILSESLEVLVFSDELLSDFFTCSSNDSSVKEVPSESFTRSARSLFVLFFVFIL